MTGVIDPTTGWDVFHNIIKRLIKDEPDQWDQGSNKMQPMLDVKRLTEQHGPSKRCT